MITSNSFPPPQRFTTLVVQVAGVFRNAEDCHQVRVFVTWERVETYVSVLGGIHSSGGNATQNLGLAQLAEQTLGFVG
jgi:hypothetical protein